MPADLRAALQFHRRSAIRCKRRMSMSKLVTAEASGYQPVRAPRGSALSCKGWQQEAALRMLMNNLDPEGRGKPESLVGHGGRGKARRNWNCYPALRASFPPLENGRTPPVQ